MERYLEFAIDLAEQLNGQTGTNPSVGAVIVNDNRIVGFGAHLKKGMAHAEVEAIKMAGDTASGGTIYVSLEPCSHVGLTPPCTEAIVNAGIKKVVYATKDSSLNKSGHDVLHEFGVEVIHMPIKRAEHLYESFFKQQYTKLPTVTLKVSTSLDGKMANDNKESKWITCKEVKKDVLKLRGQHDAILTGGMTVELDNPLLTARNSTLKNPLRVLMTHRHAFEENLNIFKNATHPVYVYTDNKQFNIKEHQNIKLKLLENTDIENVLRELYKEGISTVMVEAGPNLVSQFIEQKLVDQFIIYQAPKLIGGRGKYQYYQTDNITALSHSENYKLVSTDIIGEDLKIILRKRD